MKIKKRNCDNKDDAKRRTKHNRVLKRKPTLTKDNVVISKKTNSKKAVKKERVSSGTSAASTKNGSRTTRSSPGTSSISTPRTRSACNRISETTIPEAAAQSHPPASSTSIRPDGEIVLDKTIINRYRQRIDAIRHATRKSDKNEVFYGRCAARRNLFEDDGSEDGEDGICTRNSECIQKNRSGRSIQTTSKVYMAHVLLNVHNDNPLNPCKPPKNFSFKLHRLVRPACKTDKKRLSRLKLRMAREKSGLSSTVAKNHSPSVVSSVVDGIDTNRSSLKMPEGTKEDDALESAAKQNAAVLLKEVVS